MDLDEEPEVRKTELDVNFESSLKNHDSEIIDLV